MGSDRAAEPPNGTEAGLGTRDATSRRTKRVPLGATARRLSFERRLRLWLGFLALPFLTVLTALLWRLGWPVTYMAVALAGAAGTWAVVTMSFYESVLRPLQTLSNIVVALREDDFSFRARGAMRGDALGDLALEINALAANLQGQRSETRDAVSLAERVITSMMSPVLAFDRDGALRLINPSAERTFGLPRRTAYGRRAEELGLGALTAIEDQGVFSTESMGAAVPQSNGETMRWSVRRTGFRLRGVPHTLLVLANVDAALREEERLAWQRLIRVLGHEINNSLTPIKSIAGTLRSRLPLDGKPTMSAAQLPDFERGLAIIEERSASLNRFLQAYQQLSRLPQPVLRPVDLPTLLDQVAQMEPRLRVEVKAGPAVGMEGDADQLQQLLINLLRNAVDAALSVETSATVPWVEMTWTGSGGQVVIRIRDNGPGLANPRNLFVPFYTTKANGTGVGLVLAEQIAAAHRGSVRLSNRPEASGCDAEVQLPAVVAT